MIYGIFTLYLRFVKLCRENKSDTVVCLMTNQRSLYRGTHRQFLENICSKDDLRSRIFGTIVVKFLPCLPLLGFSTYQTHCDICPVSHRVASTSCKIEQKTRHFLQNIAFLSQSRRYFTNAPLVLS